MYNDYVLYFFKRKKNTNLTNPPGKSKLHSQGVIFFIDVNDNNIVYIPKVYNIIILHYIIVNHHDV